VVTVGEAAHIAAVAEDLGGQDRADTVDLGEGGAALGDGLADRLGGGSDLAVQAAHVAEHVPGDLLALGVGHGGRADLAQQRGGAGGAQLALGAAGVQVAQQHVEAVQGAGALGDQVVAALGQQPQHHGGVVGVGAELA
jgi:hypothetical protein